MLCSLIVSNRSRCASAPRLRPLCLLFFVVAACTNEASSPTLDTGLPPDTVLGELNADETMQICAGAEDLANALLGPERQDYLRCVGVGIAIELAGLGECAAARDNCLDDDSSAAVTIDFACEDASAIELAGCDATVGQLEACTNDISAAADAFLDSVSCALVDDPDAFSDLGDELGVAFDPAAHEACQMLTDACLAFLDLPAIDMSSAIE